MPALPAVATEPSAPALHQRGAALAAHIRTGEHRLDVRRGDLLVANRLSSTQAVMNLSKDPWTHAALVGSVDGELVAIEVGPRGCSYRALDAFAGAYRVVGMARPNMHPGCVDAIASAAEAHLAARDIEYSWDTCTVLEAIALVRCFAPARLEARVVAGAEWFARRLLRREGATATTCVGFVDECLAAACASCRPTPIWPRRERSSPWRGMPAFVDLWPRRATAHLTEPLVVRALSTPADLWLAGCWHHRVVHRPDRTTVIFDLDDPERRAA